MINNVSISYPYSLTHINKFNKCSIITVALMAGFLNMSQVVYGVNISLADLFFILVLMFLVFKNELVFPSVPMLFFLILSVTVLTTASFFVPAKFPYVADFMSIYVNYIKIIVVFLYFIVGYNLARLNMAEFVLKWYALFSLLIGVVSVIFLVFNINFLSKWLMFDNVRLKGLMNDPNYFSIIQVSAIAYFSRTTEIQNVYRMVALFFLTLSVLASGSKTGTVILIVYAVFRMLEYFTVFRNKKGLVMFGFSGLLLLAISLVLNTSHILNAIANFAPAFSRIETLFIDFNSAISEGGSGRDKAWENAVEIIKISPIIGIGVGTYGDVANILFGDRTIAHNTYLQLCVEWGVPLSILCFIYIFNLISKITFSSKLKLSNYYVFRDIIIIFLIGSLSISLNNARMFWLFLGVTLLIIKNNREVLKNWKQKSL